ncbi:MAG TPA: serine/threonine-protein kinase [Candidatus Acidoferrum sp.]|nr:serine/threonine-protein kinase [Candidatus Acidoferrum sp.]
MITSQKGRYQALEPIGSGTTSRVDKARDNVIGRTVALKTFIHTFDEDLEEQFLREAQLVGQLSHPAVVQLYDVGIDQQGVPFLVMEYVAGQTLEQYLEASTLTILRACAWAADLANALALAHRAGIIHGDVKPGNILITPENKVKLGDFGIARLTTQHSASGQLKGTPAYLAPEQIQDEFQDQRSDQFSFGVVLYQMLTGVRPFAGKTLGAVCAQILNDVPVPPSRHNPAVPPALDLVVARCLTKNPADRFASCEELAKSLYPFSRSRPRTAAPAKKHSWWSAPTGHREVWVTVSACMLLAMFIQIPGVLRAHFGIPPAPTHQYFRPGVPYEAFSYSRQTVEPAPVSDIWSDAAPRAENQHPSLHEIRVQKIALASLNKPAVAQNFSSAPSPASVPSPRANTP